VRADSSEAAGQLQALPLGVALTAERTRKKTPGISILTQEGRRDAGLPGATLVADHRRRLVAAAARHVCDSPVAVVRGRRKVAASPAVEPPKNGRAGAVASLASNVELGARRGGRAFRSP
jgi:hypothetical protein